MNIKLEKVSEQIEIFIENLAYNGLNLITHESIREIEFFLQSASQLGAFRLATSLRYLHVELKRFLERSDAFNTDRYVFFLSNCWLQSRAFISYIQSKKDDKEFYKRLTGIPSKMQTIDKLILSLIGIEKVILEGVMMGLVFYFMSSYGKTRGSILKWNLMSPFQKGMMPDTFLQRIIPNSEPSCNVEKLLTSYIEAENISCAINEGNIFLEKHKDSKVFIGEASEDIFSILKIENYYLDSEKIYKKLTKNYKITPFDLPANFLDFLYIKKVDIIETYKEGENEMDIPVCVYKINHEKNYPLVIRVQMKSVNQGLVKKLNELEKNNEQIDGLFSKLILERGQLGLYPLSIVKKNQLEFPTISEVHALDNREFLKRVYKIKK